MGDSAEEERIQLMRLASWIQELKGSRSNREMARDIGVSHTSIANASSGTANPGASTILRILNKCGVTPAMKEFAHGRSDDIKLHQKFQDLLDSPSQRQGVVNYITALHSALPKPQKRAS